MEEQRQLIQLSFPFSLWDRVRSALVIIPHQGAVIISIHALFPLIGLAFLAFLIYHGQLTPVYLGVVLLCIMFSPLCIISAVTAAYFTNPVVRELFTYTFDASGVRVNAASYEYKQPWSAFSHVKCSGPYMLFFFGGKSAHCIPLHAIESAGVKETLTELVRAHGVKLTCP